MTQLEKIILFIIVTWILNVPLTINKILNLNIGFPVLPYQYIFFIGIPFIYILSRNALGKRFESPLLLIVMYLMVLLVSMEYYNTMPNKIANYESVKLLFLFYSFYLLIINLSDDKLSLHKYIILFSTYNILLLIIFTYMGYLGFINFIDHKAFINKINPGGIYSRFGGEAVIHPNGLSLICSIGITLILFYKKKYLENINKYFIYIFIIMMFSIIILNASRGALTISILVLIIYYRNSFKNFNIIGKSLSFSGLLLLFIIIFNTGLINKLHITYRLVEETSFQEARLQQIYNSYANFIKNPFTGVGWDYTARKFRTDYISSNFFYTQLPASSGIIIFTIWFYYQFQIFYKRYSCYPILVLLFGFGPLAFYNQSLTMPTVIFASIAYIENGINRYRQK